MKPKFVSIPAAVLAVTAIAASPALAQRRGGESHETRQGENHAQVQHRGETERAQPRQQAPARPIPAPAQPAPAPRMEQRVQPRADVRTGAAVPRASVQGGVAVPRAVPRYDNHYGGYYNNGYNNGHYNNHYYYNGHYYPGAWRGWYGYAPYHPYYFRPHYSLGFSFYLGYPVPFYAYPYSVPVYGYGAPYGEVNVGPNNTGYGGVALQITPNDAAVYVDGNYAGIVSDFDGSRQPLTLVPGAHHIEVVQNGFQPWAFDVTVQPGMVTPYQGSLQSY